MAAKRYEHVYFLAGGMILLLVLFLCVIWGSVKMGIVGTALLSLVFIFFIKPQMNRIEKKALHIKKRARDADRGALAEENVASELSNLPEGYHAFNDVGFDGYNVDHVVVGPNGIFLIETKSHRGKVSAQGDTLLLNGKPPEKNFLNQAWRQTKELEGFLFRMTSREWKVKPVLCLSNAFVQVRKPVKGVVIVNLGYLVKAIIRQPGTMQDEDVEHVARVLEVWIERHERDCLGG